MKKNQTPPNAQKNIAEQSNNAVGLSEMKLYKKEARHTLKVAKSQEAVKMASGYVWMRGSGGTVLAHPSRVAHYVAQGYKSAAIPQ